MKRNILRVHIRRSTYVAYSMINCLISVHTAKFTSAHATTNLPAIDLL